MTVTIAGYPSCPKCGKQNYNVSSISFRTLMHNGDPFIKDGVMHYPEDRNTTKNDCHCRECGYEFILVTYLGRVSVE